MSIENILGQGQIRYLYLWVHPQWSSTFREFIDSEIRDYKEFILRLKDAPRVGLVQIPSDSHPEYRDRETHLRFLEKLREVDKFASSNIGRRYLIWNKFEYINGENSEHVRKLVDWFKLVENKQEDFILERDRWMVEGQKYLAKISVFGKTPYECPLKQARDFKLYRVASVVKYWRHKTPEGIRVPTTKEPFPNDSDAVYIPQ